MLMRREGWVVVALASFLLWSQPALAQGTPAGTQPEPKSTPLTPPQVDVVRLAEGDRVAIDGVLNEPVWQRAVAATNFRQRDPDNGAPATERTEVRLLIDEDRLILGVTCFDSEPDRLLGNQMQRDQPFSADDRFMWSLDPYLDGRTGYFFEINPAGAMGDGLVSGPGNGNFGGDMNKSWDGIWIARVRRDARGWTAEVEIPFKTLNFNPSTSTWGANFQRTVRRKNEESLWTGWLRNEGLLRMSNAGRISGLTGISQGIGLDVKPYVLGSGLAEPGRDRPATIGNVEAGADFFYNITPALRASFTVNTDFAETEVDDRQVNLTRFPLFFEEKREFFLAGANYYEFPPTPDTPPFFSRRIGLNQGEPQRILFGTKLLGQAGAFDIGALHVRTGEERDGALAGEDFSVVRLRRRFGQQSYLGMLYTRRGFIDEDLGFDDRHLFAADLTLSTPSFRGRYNLEGVAWVAHSTRPADLTGGGSAFGARIGFPNDPWSADMSFREVQAAYDPAIGFTPRRNIRRYNPELSFNPQVSGHPLVRSFYFNGSVEIITDLSNQLITRESELRVFDINFHSGDSIGIQLTPVTERLETDFEIEDGIVLPRGAQYSWMRREISVELADQRPIAGEISFSTGGFFDGTRRDVELGVNIRPRPGINIGLETEYNDIDLAGGSFVARVHRLDARTQFSPWISLANNVQYDSDSREVGWQMRFRWILKPGDDIFFVYTHNWLDDIDERPFDSGAEGALAQGRRYRTLDRRAAMKIVRTWRF